MKGLTVKLIYSKKAAFTLIEILVASIIGTFVAVIAVGALRAAAVSAQMVDENIETASEIRFAAGKIALDLVNLYRDKDIKNIKFTGTIEEVSGDFVNRLVFYTVSRTKARANQPESDVYEVEYFLVKEEEKSFLMRRVWPNPDREAEPGGILTVLAENIDIFEVRYFDGKQWQDEWDLERKTIPAMVEVTLAAKGPEQTEFTIESFIVNFGKDAGGFLNNFNTQQEQEDVESAE